MPEQAVIVWDLEIVPDLGGFAAANDLVGKSDDSVILTPAINRNVSGGVYQVTKQLPHNGSSFNHLVGTSSIGFSVDIRGENTNYFARDYCQQHGKAQVRNVKTVGNIKAELTGWDFWKGHV